MVELLEVNQLTVADSAHLGIRKDSVLLNIGPVSRLLNERWGKAVRVCLVVNKLVIHEVIDLKSDGQNVELDGDWFCPH